MHELNVLVANENHENEVGNIVARLNLLGYEIKSHDATHVVAYGDEVVGAFHLMDEFAPSKGVKRIKWLASSLSSEDRSIEAGKKALSYIIEYCKNIGVTKIILSVRETNNRAIHLYQKFHFKFTDHKKGEEREMVLIIM